MRYTIKTWQWASALLLAVGCRQSAPPQRLDIGGTPVVSAEATELEKLLQEHESLSAAEQDTLAGDKLIMHIETILRMQPNESLPRALPIIREHNERLVKRALSDPDFEEIIGTESAPQPREK